MAAEQYAQRGDHAAAVVVERDEVQRLVIEPVELLLARHALLDAEHLFAHAQRAGKVTGRG